ncbi:hypothetical protein OH76DRAFT_234532 [Lentinus brumalis]|uniref:Uncharacterized protein n=1 Tax=Lentinus brumalis TaxID=2498619 RepID=A0A371DHJ0_9APHY|nr:hypothetical protein OH76DRAFT_234532 [Polyporus brumalis]
MYVARRLCLPPPMPWICHPCSYARCARRGTACACACACCVPSLSAPRCVCRRRRPWPLHCAPAAIALSPLALRCSLVSRCMATRVGCCLLALLSLLCT